VVGNTVRRVNPTFRARKEGVNMTQDLHTMAPEATARLRANVYETAGGETYVLEVPRRVIRVGQGG